MISTVTEKNQITIPAELVRKLSIEKGQQIEWEIATGGLLVGRLMPKRGELARQLAGMGRDWLRKGDDPIADLIAERIREDEEEGLR